MVTWDLTKFTARDFLAVKKAAEDVDPVYLASMFARLITDCPAAWGPPDNPDTYLDRPFRSGDGSMLLLLRDLIGELNGKN